MKAVVRKAFDRVFGEQGLVYEERPREKVVAAGIIPGLHDFIYIHEKGRPDRVANGLVVWVNQNFGNVALNDETLRSLKGENPWVILAFDSVNRSLKYIWAKDVHIGRPWVTTMSVPGERAENGNLGELLLLKLSLDKTPWENWPLFKPEQAELPFDKGLPKKTDIDYPWVSLDDFLNPRKMVTASNINTLLTRLSKEGASHIEFKKAEGLWLMRAR